MELEKLIEPYVEDGRTISGQIKWLLRNAIPQTSIDFAMSSVYKRVEDGEKFFDGNALDQELLKVAKGHYETDLVAQVQKKIDEIAFNLDSEWNKLTKAQKLWQVITGKA